MFIGQPAEFGIDEFFALKVLRRFSHVPWLSRKCTWPCLRRTKPPVVSWFSGWPRNAANRVCSLPSWSTVRSCKPIQREIKKKTSEPIGTPLANYSARYNCCASTVWRRRPTDMFLAGDRAIEWIEELWQSAVVWCFCYYPVISACTLNVRLKYITILLWPYKGYRNTCERTHNCTGPYSKSFIIMNRRYCVARSKPVYRESKMNRGENILNPMLDPLHICILRLICVFKGQTLIIIITKLITVKTYSKRALLFPAKIE